MSDNDYDDGPMEDLFDDIDKMNNNTDEEDDSQQKGDDAEGENSGNEKPKKKKVATQKRISKPQLKLDSDRLCGPRGIISIDKSFKDVHLKGKGHEKSDLDMVLKKLEHWTYRLYPKLPFGDCLERMEKLGNSKIVQVYMKKLRMDLLDPDGIAGNPDTEDVSLAGTGMDQSNRDEQPGTDAFDGLLAHFSKPETNLPSVTQEQQDRMIENKRRAEEKRKSRLLLLNQSLNESTVVSGVDEVSETSTNKTQRVEAPSIDSTPHQEITLPDGDETEIMDVDSILTSLT